VRCEAARQSAAFADAAAHGNDGDVAHQLGAIGRVLFTPDAPLLVTLPRLGRPLLRSLHDHARARGRAVAAGRRAPLSAFAPALFTIALALAPVLPVLSPRLRCRSAAALGLYGAALSYAATHAGLRHRSVAVALAFGAAAPGGHLAYGTGFLRGVFEGLTARKSPTVAEPLALNTSTDEGAA
jgi:hypothetical protein